MVHHSKIPWEYIILGALRRAEADLLDIYKAIEIAQDEQRKQGGEFLPSHLFEEQQSAGNRPKYRQTIRGYMSILRKRNLVEWVYRGRYRRTSDGKKWLKEYEG